MKVLCMIYLVLSLTLGFLFFSSCASKDSGIQTTIDLEAEKKWEEAFDRFVLSLPQCPKGRHPLVEGQREFGRFSGSCFECKRPLGITDTEVNHFFQKRTTNLAVVYTCSEGCRYNVCGSCAK